MLSSASDIGDIHKQLKGREGRPYEMRPACASEIPAINKLFFAEYGDSYPYPLGELKPSGIYIVAVYKPTGEIIGFARSAESSAYGGAWELGGLIVSPDHRGQDVAKEMTMLRLLEIKRRGGKVAVSEPVCYRKDCASQHNLLKYGFVMLGIQPGKYPDIQEEVLLGQPESVLLCARWLEGDPQFGERRLFLPQGYRNLTHTFMPREIHERSWQPHVIGSMPSVRHQHGHREETHVGSEFVNVPANWPESAEAIEHYMAQGYAFSCILPGFGQMPDGSHYDFVRLYRLPEYTRDRFDFRYVHVIEQLRVLHTFMSGEYHLRTT